MVELGDLASWGSGGTPSRSRREFFEGSIPWAAIGDLNDGDVWRTEESITSEALNSSSAKMVPAGSLMIAMYGSIGKLGIPRIELATNQAIAFATPGDRLDLRYLYHCMRRDRARLLASGNGGTQSNISQTKLKAWKIPLPPLPEQRRIAAILDHADTLRTKRRESLTRLDELTQSIFDEMFGDPMKNRNGHPVVPLSEIVDPARPITYGILKPGPDQEESGVPYVRVVDIQRGEVQVENLRATTPEIAAMYRRSRLVAGDLLISIRGHVGRMAVTPPEIEGANITQDTARLAVVGANTEYVRACIGSPGLRFWMDRHTKGVAVRGLNLGDLKKMPVPLPPLSQQREFNARIERVSYFREANRKALRSTEALFGSLQTRAFGGDL